MRLTKTSFYDKELNEKIDEFNFQNTRKNLKNIHNELDKEKNAKVESDYKNYKEVKQTKTDMVVLPLEVLGTAACSAVLAVSATPALAVVGGICTLVSAHLLYQEIKNHKEQKNCKTFTEFYKKLYGPEARETLIASIDERNAEMEQEYQLKKA